MTERLIRFRRERDWEQFHNPKDQFLSLALEAAELLELAQWRDREELEKHLSANRALLEDELADILGWVLLIAHDRGIDLPAAFEAKMRKNQAKYPVEKARGRADKWHRL